MKKSETKEILEEHPIREVLLQIFRIPSFMPLPTATENQAEQIDPAD